MHPEQTLVRSCEGKIRDAELILFQFNTIMAYLAYESQADLHSCTLILLCLRTELKSQDLTAKMRGARAARNMLCDENAPRTEMVKAGVVAPLVAALDRRDW